jgi:hypothetical protein
LSFVRGELLVESYVKMSKIISKFKYKIDC